MNYITHDLPSGIQCRATLLSLSLTDASAPCCSYAIKIIANYAIISNQFQTKVTLIIIVVNIILTARISKLWSCKWLFMCDFFAMSPLPQLNLRLKQGFWYGEQKDNFSEKDDFLGTVLSYFLKVNLQGLPGTWLLPSTNCLLQYAEMYHYQIPCKGHLHLEWKSKRNANLSWVLHEKHSTGICNQK